MMVLVDENDNEIGLMEKMEAHEKGLLHRAFSGFIFNDKKEMLLQRRALHKYHNGGIWSNTVCSHPRHGETLKDAVRRRTFEELGFYADYEYVGRFIYKASFPNGLTEHEFDNVFISKYQGQEIKINHDEVCDYKWITRKELENEIKKSPESFSFWLKEILNLKFIDDIF